MNHVAHLFSSADISIFYRELANFGISRNRDMDSIQIHKLHNLILLTFLDSLRIFWINIVTILMMLAKMAIPGLLKVIFIWKDDYDVIISVHGVTNKIYRVVWNIV